MEALKESAAMMEQNLTRELATYDGDDEELFEIDLEALNRMPLPSEQVFEIDLEALNRMPLPSEQVFEIDLEALERLPPAAKSCERHQWSSGHQQGALLANCILPITYICNAVPMDAAEATGAEHRDAKLWDFSRAMIHG
uniref:2-isopropylmalate synthase n=1 Tax=Anthurium amnicola TaxID=1678845 RepID=A0A1D1ZLF4_9ARAE